jgi:hypothetical protein
MPSNDLYGFPQPLSQVFPAPIIAQRAPLTSDFRYPIGQQWIDEVGDDAYILVDVTANSATWNVTATTPGNVDTLTGNSGGAITPSAGNINVIGSGVLAFAGAGSTLTGSITPGSSLVATIQGTSGGALSPSSGNMIITGSGVVAVAGSGHTLTISVTPGTSLLSTLTGGSGGAISPTTGNINLAGTANQIATAGSGSTITFSLVGPYTPTTYTVHGVLLGNTSSSIAVTSAGSTGQVLIGSTSADPAFGALGVNSGLTQHGVLLGENNSAIAATGAGSTGQVLIGATSADPAFGALGVNSNLTGLVLGNTNSAFTATSFVAAAAFTPAFSLGTPGDATWTYSSRVGRYTQLGSVVFFVAELVWSAFTNATGSGNWQLNIPVVSGAFARAGQVNISGSGIDISGEATNFPVNFVGEIGSGVSLVVLSAQEQGAVQAASALFSLTVTQVKSTGTLTASGFYFAS